MIKKLFFLLSLVTMSAQAVNLSKEGYQMIDFGMKEDISSVERYVTSKLKNYPYTLPQEFYDGLILTGVQIGHNALDKSDLIVRLNKCRGEGKKINRLDYRFTTAAVLDLPIERAKNIRTLMNRPVENLGYDLVDFSITAQTKPKPAQGKAQKAKPAQKAQQTSKPKKRTYDKKNHKFPDDEYLAGLKKPIYKCSRSGRELIKKREGLRLKAYWDVNGYSIGYGHHSSKIKKNTVIQIWEADDYFCSDIIKFEKQTRKMIEALPYKYNFSQGFIDGFISVMYNCGPGNLEKSRFYRELKKCRVKDGKMNMNDYYRVTDLIKKTCIPTEQHAKRREAECFQMQNASFVCAY